MMDHEAFDRLIRALGVPGTRRSALAALLGTGVAGSASIAEAAKKGKGKGKKRKRDRKKARKQTHAAAVPRNCFTNDKCPIGKQKNAHDCNFEESTAFTPGLNLTLFNASGANFRGVVSSSNFTQANLHDACLVDANFSGADWTRINTSGAIFCRTTMPNGDINDSGCRNGTRCCPTSTTTTTTNTTTTTQAPTTTTGICIEPNQPCNPSGGPSCCNGRTCGGGAVGCGGQPICCSEVGGPCPSGNACECCGAAPGSNVGCNNSTFTCVTI
jgi:hypothetical protein